MRFLLATMCTSYSVEPKARNYFLKEILLSGLLIMGCQVLIIELTTIDCSVEKLRRFFEYSQI